MTREDALLKVNELYTYSKEFGHVIYKSCQYRPSVVGSRVGSTNSRGYRTFRICGYTFTEHQIAWYINFGEIPPILDHINGNKDDNRLENLRSVTRSQNNMNRRHTVKNKLGFKGVFLQKDMNKYRAVIRANKVLVHLGLYDTPEEAYQAYLAASKTLHGEYAHE